MNEVFAVFLSPCQSPSSLVTMFLSWNLSLHVCTSTHTYRRMLWIFHFFVLRITYQHLKQGSNYLPLYSYMPSGPHPPWKAAFLSHLIQSTSVCYCYLQTSHVASYNFFLSCINLFFLGSTDALFTSVFFVACVIMTNSPQHVQTHPVFYQLHLLGNLFFQSL